MEHSENWSEFIIPTIFVALTVGFKEIVIDKNILQSQIVLIDIVMNCVFYLISTLVVDFGIDRMFKNEPILESGVDIVVAPVIHGLLNGSLRGMIHSTATLARAKQPITFLGGFTDGVLYNVIAKYTSSPIVNYFSE